MCPTPTRFGGFFIGRKSLQPVLEYARDWIGFAITVTSPIFSFWRSTPRKRKLKRVSYRRLKFGWFEWTSYNREDDIQS